MKRLIWLLQLVLVFGLFLTVSAQDAEMLRHFDYDQKAPLGIKQLGVQRRAHATVYDITYDSPKGGVVPAYLVVPKGRGLSPPSSGDIGIGRTLRCVIERSFSRKRLRWPRQAWFRC